jgi:hypothetical protein
VTTKKQIVSTPQEAIPVYRWTDGSMVYLARGKAFSASGYTSSDFWAFQILFHDGTVVEMFIDLISAPFGGLGTLENLRREFPITNDTPGLSAMLLGFIFDLMGPDYFVVRELIWDDVGVEAFGPRAPEVVSDEKWALRYETTMRHGRPILDDLQIDVRKAKTRPSPPPVKPGEPLSFDWGDDEDGLPPPQRWYAEWVDGSTAMTTPVFETKEEAIDDALRRYPAVPESQRDEWFATRAHIEHGAWLIPSPEELEVIRILDERLPFFLPYADLREWLSARGLC